MGYKMENVLFGYVILHYQDINVTERSVSNILKRFQNSIIVIVDNCSPNGSGRDLYQHYKNISNVDVILNKANDGFAKGNNLGYRYLRCHYSVDYIVVMNNDVMIEDDRFETEIIGFMCENGVDVCGPDIVTLNNNHQNPLLTTAFSTTYLRRRIIFDRIKCVLLNVDLLYHAFSAYKTKRGKLMKSKQPQIMNCVLHGACIIYNKRYISEEGFVFLPITFMYNEEAILYDYLLYRGYRTGYCDKVSVTHLEGVSTSKISKDEKSKYIFRLKNNTNSLREQVLQRKKYKFPTNGGLKG